MSFALLDISWADEVFDGMMTSRAKIYRKEDTLDRYNNISASTFVAISATMTNGPDTGDTVDTVPCLVQNLRGEELNTPPAPASQTSHGIQEFKLFMRILQVDNPTVDLNIKHWMQVLTKSEVENSVDFKDPNDPNAGAMMYNRTSISNPALQDHHLEV